MLRGHHCMCLLFIFSEHAVDALGESLCVSCSSFREHAVDAMGASLFVSCSSFREHLVDVMGLSLCVPLFWEGVIGHL